MIIVHDLDDSRSQRILWLLEELGVPYEIRQHKRVVAESGAIIDYVWEWSTSAACKRCGYNDYVRWMHYAEGSGMLAPIVRINVARVGEAASPALRRLDSEIALHLNYLDSALNGRPYILGPELSAADIQLSFIGELAAARFGIASYPNLEAWIKRFQARPAYKAALARGRAYSFAA